MDDLPLQVRLVHAVEVQDPERSDAGGGQVHRHRRAETARPDAQDLRVEELALSLPADARQDDVPRVAADLLLAERRQRHVTVTSSSATTPSCIVNPRSTGFARSESDMTRYVASG